MTNGTIETAEQYFEGQAGYNKWLQQLTESERAHIISMLKEHAEQYAAAVTAKETA